MPIDRYPAGMKNIDIGCCPLQDTIFNRAKTYIKAMEYAASGAPVVASPVVYHQIIEHGVDGYIAEGVDDWVEYLSRLVEDYSHRKEMAKRLLAKVRKYHSLENQVWRWVEAWTTLVEGFRNKNGSQILLPKGVTVNAHAAA
jgi:glycosyltransferase involved in cell wall biosynthesis